MQLDDFHPEHQTNLDTLIEDVRVHGFKDAVIVDKNHNIISGNRRFAAAKAMKEDGYDIKIPVIVVADNLTEAQKLALTTMQFGTTTIS